MVLSLQLCNSHVFDCVRVNHLQGIGPLNHVGLVIKAALVQPSLVQYLPQMAVFEVSRRSICTRLGATLNLLTVRTHKHVVVRFPLW